MTERARVVVVGGGVTGCSVALHLARAGWTDAILIDKGELTSGSTAHAAGLVTMFNPSPTMTSFRRYSVELYGELGVFDAVGSLHRVESRDARGPPTRHLTREGIGMEVELLLTRETRKLMPAASPESLFGSVWVPADGFLDPHTATYALAKAAQGLEARPDERARDATELGRGPSHPRRAPSRRIETEGATAAGIRAPRVAAMAGVSIPPPG